MTSVDARDLSGSVRAGAVIAGLPYGVASNVREALNGMLQSPSRPAGELGDLVRNASAHTADRGRKLSVWHGSADRTVNPANANEIVKQWLDVHDLPAAPMSERHGRWLSASGVVERRWRDHDRILHHHRHGARHPARRRRNDERYGAEGAFLIEAGISSSYHIASFFGLTERVSQPRRAAGCCQTRGGASLDATADAGHCRRAAADDDAGRVRPSRLRHCLVQIRARNRGAGRSMSAPSLPAR